jgi:hypothetical protein
VRALDDHHTGHKSSPRQDSDSLPFVKLDPQRMLSSGAHLTQSQVTIVSDFSDCKTGPIQCTRNYASRTTAAFAQNEIAKRVTFPTRHRLHDRIGRSIFPTWRRVERDPIAKHSRTITAVLSRHARSE